MENDAVRRTFEAVEPEYLAVLPTISLRARDLLGLMCLHGGGEPPQMPPDLPGIYRQAMADPDTCLTLTAAFDCAGGPFQFPREDNAYHRRMDLHVLQRLMLAPGDGRTARELFRRMKENIPSLDGICLFESPNENWPSWPQEAVQAYLRGLENPVPDPQDERMMAAAKLSSVAEIEQADRLYIRPHHLMCIMCHYGGGMDQPLQIDNLWEPLLRIKDNPQLEITLIEGDCMVCPPCSGYDPRSGTCIRICGLRDRRKDLDTLQRLDLLPGDTLPARELFARYLERIPHASLICRYTDHTVPEWQSCGSATAGRYEKGLERIRQDLDL